MISCRWDAHDAGETLLGTAPLARSWLVIEQPGPWGRDAIVDGHLPADVAAHLAGAKGTGTTVLLARHAEHRAASSGRNVWAAYCAPGHSRLRHGVVADLEEVLNWDLSAIGQGALPALDEEATAPLMLVCTHSGRDRCCAVEGRSLSSALMARLAPAERSRVWECSHIGGHRFAPVLLSLPLGVVHGRVSIEEALAIFTLAPDGEVLLDRLRGRSSLSPVAQVAVAEVMRRYGISDIDSLKAMADGPLVRVRHGDGHSWTVDVESVPLPRDRQESCAKPAVPGHCLTCVAVEADY